MDGPKNTVAKENTVYQSRAAQFFLSAREEEKALIREILREERDVMHLKRRSDIHQRIYDHVKRVIK